MASINIDISKRFMIFSVSVMLLMGFIGWGYATEGQFNLPLAWVLDNSGASVDNDGDGVIDNSEHLEGLSSSDLIAAGEGDITVELGTYVPMSGTESAYYTSGAGSSCIVVSGADGQASAINDGYICDLETGNECWNGVCLDVDTAGDRYCRALLFDGADPGFTEANDGKTCDFGKECWDSNCIEVDNGGTYWCRDYDWAAGTYSNAHGGTECSNGNLCLAGECLDYMSVFVTSGTYSGNLGGVSGADAKCQSHANAAGLSGVFKAWLSTDTSNPADTFTHSNVPYRLVDNTVIAINWDDLIDGEINHGIDLDQNGNSVTGHVWTSTRDDGTLHSYWKDCSEWTSGSSSDFADYGYSDDIFTSSWSDYSTSGRRCDDDLYLYCFEQ